MYYIQSTPQSSIWKRYEYVSKEYTFDNYYKSEPQIDEVSYTDDLEIILKAFDNICQTHARKHTAPGVDYEDLYCEARLGVVEVVDFWMSGKKKKYPFKQHCLYKIREVTYQYCLNNRTEISTPFYIQRGCQHVAQILKILKNAPTSLELIGSENPSESEIETFLLDENERLPLKSDEFIRNQINPNLTPAQFIQVYENVTQHKRGSGHSFAKKNLTDVGKVLHLKQKIWYNATSNNMKFSRVIGLILSAQDSKTSCDAGFYGTDTRGPDKELVMLKVLERGSEICGKECFDIFTASKFSRKKYEDIENETGKSKKEISFIVRDCLKKLQQDPLLKQYYEELE